MNTITDILFSIKEYLKYKMSDGLNIVLDSVKKEKGTEEQDIVITLLRIEEETSRKPQNVYYTKSGDTLYPTSPDINVNLELLISSQASNYESALIQIADVIGIMNSVKTASRPDGMSEEAFGIIRSLSISMMNISFEQNLSMWQTLGGHLSPSVAYKVRMVTVEGVPDTTRGERVKKVFYKTGDMTQNHEPYADSEADGTVAGTSSEKKSGGGTNERQDK